MIEENQNKKNLIPYEYMGTDEKRWKDFNDFVIATYKNNKKSEFLLRKKFTKEDEKEWKDRSLNDTKYISRFVFNLINDYLLMDNSINLGKKRVTAVNGSITAYCRKIWGIEKIREDGDLHHSIDASVIACITDGIIQKITTYNKVKEGYYQKGNGYTDLETGEVYTKEEYDKIFAPKLLKQPYINFVKEKNELIFPPQIVNEINELEVYYRTKTNKKAKAFNSEQLKMIREYNKTDSKANYYFELLFQLDDIKKEDIDYCTPKYLDREKWVFIRPNGTPIRINSKIKELIIKTADQKELEISYNMGSRYLENITKNLKSRNCFYKESNLNIYDIRESSKNFFIVCPNCKNRLESDANNWVLAKTEHDDDYRLVCNVCKGEPQDEN
jgi:hypothetical protein